MSCEIQKATLADLPRILEIYEEARAYMRASGNPDQWGTTHPAQSMILQDIEEQKLYLCKEGAEILGVFFYEQGIDPTYVLIEEGQWLNEEPYGVIHRLAVAQRCRGVASFCFDWAMQQCPQLRIDTHENNIAMQKALAKNGFQYCGVIHIYNGDDRIAYHKSAEKVAGP